MFAGVLKSRNGRRKEKSAEEALYSCALAQTRDPVFYERGGVPDTFDGRFDLLLAHVFLILHALATHERYDAVSQGLFDAMFRDMDQTLREMGIGDMGIPKHMKRMMKAFNGRMHAYRDAMTDGECALEDALIRNLYGTLERPDLEEVRKMAGYMRANAEYLKFQNGDDIACGKAVFAAFDDEGASREEE